MSNNNEIISTLVKSLECADNFEIAEAYAHLVSCGDCPYWSDCSNEHECDVYIIEKLQEDCKNE